MRRSLLVALTATVLCSAASAEFRGAFFSVAIPAGMKITDKRPSATKKGAFDGVTVATKDGAVQITVCAPQWMGPCVVDECQPGEQQTARAEKVDDSGVSVMTATCTAANSTRAITATTDYDGNFHDVWSVQWRDTASKAAAEKALAAMQQSFKRDFSHLKM